MFLRGAWRENDRIRREGSAILADAARAGGAGRFIQESFAPIYADGGDRWLDERWPLRPVRYNRTILDAEHTAKRFGETGGVGVILRFAAFYGPDAVHVHQLIGMVRRGWAPLPGSPDGYVSSVSHDDAAAAVVAALELPGGVYNVSDDEPLRRRELVDALADALEVPPPKLPPAWLAKHGGDLMELLSRSLRISNRALRAASSWVPRYPSLREGWRATLAELD
jgi:nucleoside-diphosphate-sugar epimerase